MITLVMLDIIIKIKEMIEDFEVFPTSFAVGFHDQLDSRAPKTRRGRMLSLQEFKQDPVRLFAWSLESYDYACEGKLQDLWEVYSARGHKHLSECDEFQADSPNDRQISQYLFQVRQWLRVHLIEREAMGRPQEEFSQRPQT